jgi:hypothetical protein
MKNGQLLKIGKYFFIKISILPFLAGGTTFFHTIYSLFEIKHTSCNNYNTIASEKQKQNI